MHVNARILISFACTCSQGPNLSRRRCSSSPRARPFRFAPRGPAPRPRRRLRALKVRAACEQLGSLGERTGHRAARVAWQLRHRGDRTLPLRPVRGRPPATPEREHLPSHAQAAPAG
eukprot:3989982-Prymnesium_polylepis.1